MLLSTQPSQLDLYYIWSRWVDSPCIFLICTIEPTNRSAEPMSGFEPLTCCLQNSYSTAELHRHCVNRVIIAKFEAKENLSRSKKWPCVRPRQTFLDKSRWVNCHRKLKAPGRLRSPVKLFSQESLNRSPYNRVIYIISIKASYFEAMLNKSGAWKK